MKNNVNFWAILLIISNYWFYTITIDIAIQLVFIIGMLCGFSGLVYFYIRKLF